MSMTIEAPQDSLVTAEVAPGAPPPGKYTEIRVHGGEMPFLHVVHASEAPPEEKVVQEFVAAFLELGLRLMYETLQDVFGRIHITLIDRKWWAERQFRHRRRQEETEWVVAMQDGVSVHMEVTENHAMQFYLVADFNIQAGNSNDDIEAIHVQHNGEYSVVAESA